MSEFSQGIPSTKPPSTPVKMPRYRVTRRADQSLAFDPPTGSRELANALSIKYPLCENLEQQLQSALLDFINKEEEEEEDASSEYTFTPPENRQQSLSPNVSSPPIESPNSSRSSGPTLPRNSFQSSISVWSITTGKPVEKKRNRIKYDTEKRVKVAGVRKYGACDFHRKKKTECTCNIFPISPKNLAQRRRSMTQSTSNSATELSTSTSVLSMENNSPEESLDAAALANDADLFNANLPQLHDSDFDPNFFWGSSTLPTSTGSLMAFSTDAMSTSELSLFNSNSPTDTWHQGLW